MGYDVVKLTKQTDTKPSTTRTLASKTTPRVATPPVKKEDAKTKKAETPPQITTAEPPFKDPFEEKEPKNPGEKLKETMTKISHPDVAVPEPAVSTTDAMADSI